MPNPSPVTRVVRRLTGRPEAEPSSDGGDQEAAPRSIGVIFVHGIGNQPARETLLNWANSIIEVLAAWRREYDEGPASLHPIGEDPVQQAGVDTDAGVDDRVWVRIGIPGTDPAHPPATWLLTEAYWAGQVRAPALGHALRYLRGHIGALITGIASGSGRREAARTRRLDEIVAAQP
jgi:hypothetical protein